ncbi:MAG: hypothetical protein JNL50_02950 [Phycisphaerae bacterium]|nr:hypothetical protein [Phycisphaerae bacterium]
MNLRMVLLEIALPTLVAGIIVMGAFLAARRRAPASATPSGGGALLPSWIPALAFGATYLVGARFVLGKFPDLPPTQSAEWSVLIALAAMVLGLLVSKWESFGLLPLVACGAIAGGVLGLALWRAITGQFEGWIVRGAWIGASVAAVYMPVMCVHAAARHTRSPAIDVAAWLAMTISCGAIVLAHTAKLAQLASLLSMAGGFLWLAGVLTRRSTLATGGAVVGVGMHSGLWLMTYFTAEAHPASALLGALAPAGAALVLLPRVRRSGALARWLVPIGACLILSLAGLAVAAWKWLGEDSGYPG